MNNFLEELSKIKKGKKNFVFILIGPQLSGKSTFIEKYLPNITVLSKDEIVLSEFENEYNDYNLSYQEYNLDSIKHKRDLVNTKFYNKILEQAKIREDVVIDCMNLTERARGKIQFREDFFIKVAVIFPPITIEEFERRNQYRKLMENKYISTETYLSSLNSEKEILDREKITHRIYLK